jgi:regulator of replication initiation timing
MTANQPGRLDRIEALLEDFMKASISDHFASDQRLTQLERVIERDRALSNERLTRLENLVQEVTQDVKENTAATKDLRAAVETQKVIVDEVIDQLVTVRDENKRILEYLFGQQRGNGHNDQPQT